MKKFVLLLAIALFGLNASSAQNFEWRHMNSAIMAFAQLPGSPNTVFAGDVAGLIRRSDDKGATWKIVSMQAESQILDIAFLNATTGFATTAEWGLVLKTVNGGKTWNRIHLVSNDNGQVQSVRGTHRIVVVDESTAFFDIFNHPISAPSGKAGIVTRDGGLTFKSDTTPGEVYHVSGSTLLAFGREVMQFGLSKFTVYKSTDKGLSWNIVKTSPAGLSNTFDNNGIELAHFLNE
ncbi:MAG TPA: YCF48-related protein, partial [Patescibacteria group bacterium]|nr:YCF48-related protein [Patescibacteria group bacterium]